MGEVKVYLGKDMFRDDVGNILLTTNKDKMKDKSNKKVGLHNDINFDDDGIQKIDDTADGSHPIATYNVGATRQLIFKWMMKDNDNKKPTREKVKVRDKNNRDKFIDD